MPVVRTIGTDTELFGFHIGRSQHAALCGLIGGSKSNPKPMNLGMEGFALQEDNVAVEFNIPPARNSGEFNLYIDAALKETQKTLALVGMSISQHTAVSFDIMELTHPTALVFGCDPDFNAWTHKENPRPMCDDRFLRTSGGHVHVGSDANMIKGVQMMDLYLGVPSVLLDNSEGSVKRRELYGKAGAMRPKPYGWEYRVLSNYWVFTQALREWVFVNTTKAVHASEQVNIGVRKAQHIQSVINKGMKDKAIELIEEYNIPLPRGINVNSFKSAC